jgi:hypothetical protein
VTVIESDQGYVLSLEGDGGLRASDRGRWIDGFTDLILRRRPRGEHVHRYAYPETVSASLPPTLEKALANEAAFEAKLETWLVQRRKR